jgi:hypothetical protein
VAGAPAVEPLPEEGRRDLLPAPVGLSGERRVHCPRLWHLRKSNCKPAPLHVSPPDVVIEGVVFIVPFSLFQGLLYECCFLFVLF